MDALPVTVVVDQRVLRQQPILLIVGPGDLVTGILESFQHRHAVVLVRVCLFAREGCDEVLPKPTLISLRAGACRRDHDAALGRQRADPITAGRREIHDDDLLGREPSEIGGHVRGGDVRAGKIEFRCSARGTAMPDEHDEQPCLRFDALGEIGERGTDVLPSRSPTDALVTLGILGEIHDMVGRNLEVINDGRHQCGAPIVEPLHVGGFPADAAHHRHVRLCSARHREQQAECGEPDDARHASPRWRRYVHSAARNARSAMRRMGMSQRSRSSRTVVPLSVKLTSSGRVSTDPRS